MTIEQAVEKALAALEALQNEFTLPPRTSQTIQRLASRLRAPVRLALMGPAGAGKSTLVNVLLGQVVMPKESTLPTTQIHYGETPSLTLTLADGRQETLETLDFDAAAALEPLLVELALPLPHLQHMGLLDVVTDGSDREMVAAARWAAKRAEMALWVTRGYDHLEQEIWRQVPDALQDHAILVLNGIDAYSSTELQTRIETHEAFARNAFLSVAPVSAERAVAALTTPNSDQHMRTSGCQALIDAINAHIRDGRQADIDAAEMYLSRYGRSINLPIDECASAQASTRVVGPAERAMMSKANATAEMVAILTKTEPVTPPDPGIDAREGAAAAEADPAFYLKRFGEIEEVVPPTAPANSGEALRQIEACAEDLLGQMSAGPDVDAETILQCCLETVEALSGKAPDGSPLEETVYQASDYLLLLQIERSESVADDALAALLQVKREFQLLAVA